MYTKFLEVKSVLHMVSFRTHRRLEVRKQNKIFLKFALLCFDLSRMLSFLLNMH